MKLLVAALLLASGACRSPSRCSRYAEFEAQCTVGTSRDHEVAHTLALGMCEAADSSDPDVARAGTRFAREAECADNIDTCEAFKKCVAALK